MAPRVVYLHIGSTKAGTTFIQRVLWSNEKKLKADGVALPAEGQYVFGRAARALHRWRPDDASVPRDWKQVADTVNGVRSDAAILSQEFLSWLDPDQVRAMVASIENAAVKVVFTARDLARLIPAQWQSAIRQRRTWSLTEYAHGVQHGSDEDPRNSPYRHFWHRLDYATTLRTWSDVVGVDNVTVVTVPPPGAEPDELWRRFCAATDLDPARYRTDGVRNVSMGAASCEVMRRLNALPQVQAMPREDYSAEVNGTLTRRVLSLRDQPEPKITLPDAQRDWALSRSEEIAAEVASVGTQVIGSLEDLRSGSLSPPYQAPEDLPAEDLLEVALDALASLAVAHSKGDTAPKPGLAQPRARRQRKNRPGIASAAS